MVSKEFIQRPINVVRIRSDASMERPPEFYVSKTFPSSIPLEERTAIIIEQQRAHSRLRGHLLPAVLEYYDNLIPSHQIWYEKSLDKVTRQQQIRESGFLVHTPDHIETNLDHVETSLDIATEYKQDYPELEEAGLDWNQVQKYILIHDCGELADKIGDVQPLDRSKRERARKRLEPTAAKKAVIALIPDPDFQQVVLEDYDTYTSYPKLREGGAPRNINIEMARFIDKAQGTTRVAEVAFNVHKVDKETGVEMAKHLMQTVVRMIEPQQELMVALPTEGAREAMKNILGRELGYLKKYGPRQVSKTFEPYAS